jgi:hypothetical protein
MSHLYGNRIKQSWKVREEIVDHISYHHPFREKREDKLTGPPPGPPLQIQVECPRFDCECSQSVVYLESPKSTSHPPCPNRAKCKRQLLSFSFALGFSLFHIFLSFPNPKGPPLYLSF